MDVNIKLVGLGAVTAAAIDGALEVNFENDPEYWRPTPEEAKFPYWEPSLVLPPVDDWIVGGLSVVPLLSKKTRDFGIGMCLYSGPMLLQVTMRRLAREIREGRLQMDYVLLYPEPN